MIVINMVIVSDNVEHGAKMGRHMAETLRREHEDFRLSLHVRRSINKLTDDHFERIDG